MTTTVLNKPTHAFVLAAGLGTRLRPYTDTVPKPMVQVAGRALLDYIFDGLKEAGIRDIVVNVHHKPEILRAYLATRTDVAITQSYEEELLDTGGGIVKALGLLGTAPFFIVNGDAFWTDGPTGNVYERLAASFDADAADILLLLQPVAAMKLTHGVGDYDLVAGRPVRNREKTGAYMFAGVRLCAPSVFADAPSGKFSFLQLMDRAETQGRLGALVHDGDWHHISTPADLEAVDASMKDRPPAA